MDAPAQIAANLLPQARRLAAAAKALATELSAKSGDAPASDSLTADLDRLRETAAAFVDEIPEIVAAAREKYAGAPNEAESARSVRHDLKNRLNRVAGPAQFVDMEFPEDGEKPASLTAVLDLCECCRAAIDANDADTEVASPAVATPAPEPGRILVADDDAENRALLARLLEAQGHDVVFAVNGREALEAIRADDRLDAVLLDIRMPEMDGFAVLENLRESGHLRHTPVIVVTGLREERDAVRCIEIGAEDFLSRPIRPALLTARLNASLEKKRLREKVFEQHFTPELAREFARNPDPVKMKGRNAEVTVLFCDIRGFSAVSERLGPEQTIDWLGAVMGEFSGCVLDEGGVLVDYTGDELLALWGAPGEQPDHAARACRAALAMLDRLPGLNAEWRPKTGAETAIGIGVSTGPALVGNIGTHRKFKYGPLGTTVNLGSRVQGVTKLLHTHLLATGETVARLDEAEFPHRRLCRVRVRNIAESVELHELAPPGQSGWPVLCAGYGEALDCFENRRFSRASAILGDLLVQFPGDGPSLQLMARVVDAMLRDGEGEVFDPVWELGAR